MSKLLIAIIGLALLASLVLFSTTYTVRFHEVAIRARFGQAGEDDIIRTPGLHFKLPFFADRITTIDKRLQLRESPLETVVTSDGLQVMAKAFVLWQVQTQDNGPLTFVSSFPSGIDQANAELAPQFRTALIAGVSRFRFDELIGTGSRLADAEQAIQKELSGMTAKGMVPVSVGISQMVLTPKASTAVLNRMKATREGLAQAERQRGNSQAAAINARAAAMREKIMLFANQRAEEIRAAGNKKAAEYLQVLAQNEDLAVFIAWIDALKVALSENTTLVIPTVFAPFHMMQLNTATNSSGIPLPGDASLAGSNNAPASDAAQSDAKAGTAPRKPGVDGGS
jgi:membrane protease subunit HflC